MTLSEKIIDLSRKGYTVRFQASETFPNSINITLFKTNYEHNMARLFKNTRMSCEYGIPPEEEIVGVLSELEAELKEA